MGMHARRQGVLFNLLILLKEKSVKSPHPLIVVVLTGGVKKTREQKNGRIHDGS